MHFLHIKIKYHSTYKNKVTYKVEGFLFFRQQICKLFQWLQNIIASKSYIVDSIFPSNLQMFCRTTIQLQTSCMK